MYVNIKAKIFSKNETEIIINKYKGVKKNITLVKWLIPSLPRVIILFVHGNKRLEQDLKV